MRGNILLPQKPVTSLYTVHIDCLGPLPMPNDK